MANARRFSANALRLAVVAGLAVGDLSGCASTGDRPDPNDSCGQQHVDFAASKHYYSEEIAEGAAKGAITGAAFGAITAAVTGGNVGRGAAIGAGTGAVIGASNAYYEAKQKQYADQVALTKSVYTDMTKATGELDRVSTTFLALRNCRFQSTARIKAQFKAGALTRDQATAQLAYQKGHFTDELALAREYGTHMAEQEKNFTFASQSLAQDDPAAQKIIQHHGSASSGSTAPSAGGNTIYQAANLRKTASATAPLLSTLVPGTKVKTIGDATADGWRQVALDNGTAGFVRDSVLQPPSGSAATPTKNTPSTPAPATATASAPPQTDDQKVQVAYAATETIPQKRQSYDSAVGQADTQSNLAFNLDQSTPPT